jgi:hypothetical protein
MVKPSLSKILEIYLKLMDDIDSEELVKALQDVIVIFGNEIGPFACEIVQ